MKLLIIGGTRFVGRHLVDVAVAQGMEVTLFNRGQSNPDLYPAIEQLRGDRDGGLAVLAGRKWDVVIDTCGYVPRLVRDSAEFLAGSVGVYCFISTISVYGDLSIVGLDEEGPLGTMEDETVEEITGETYGPLKVLCEQVVEEVYGERGLIVRPGLIVGPHDPTDRFSYWPYRMAQGGEVLAPGGEGGHTQFIDGRDLAEFTIKLIMDGQNGVYNATGPDYALTWGVLLETCEQVTGVDSTVTWVGEDFLTENGVQPWVELPLWIPNSPDYAGFDAVSVQKGIGAGLVFRPLAETVRDTLGWLATRPGDYKWSRTLNPAKEKELLAKWHEQ